MKMYQYAEEHSTEETIEQNHQEIEQAIDEVTGKNIDKRIQQIWEKFIK